MNVETTSETPRVRTAIQQWIVDEIRPNLVITFGAGLPVSPDVFRGKVEQFLKMRMRAVYGRRWCDTPAAQWPVVMGLPEHAQSNLHFQSVARAEGDFMDDLLTAHDHWAAYRKGGHYHCAIIENAAAYAWYMTKEAQQQDCMANMLVFCKHNADLVSSVNIGQR